MWGVWGAGGIIVAVSFCAIVPVVLTFYLLKLKNLHFCHPQNAKTFIY